MNVVILMYHLLVLAFLSFMELYSVTLCAGNSASAIGAWG